MASLLLIALLVLPWLVVARRRHTSAVPTRPAWTPPAWTPPAPRQPQEAWVDPDDWWREASALPSRSPRVDAQQAAPAVEV